MAKSNLVVKTHHLNTVLQNLKLAEIRIVQLAVVDARETGKGLTAETPLRIDALRYAEVFDTTRQNGYLMMKEAEDTLFNRRFSYIDDEGKLVKSRWLSQVRYLDDEGAIEVVFTPAVVQGITRIDGAEEFFTKYLLEQTATMTSNYSVRLYELLVQWKQAKKTPMFELQEFRGQLGVEDDEYKAMSNFKIRVLDLAVDEINEKSDLNINYTQKKKGRKIVGFTFTVHEKPKAKTDVVSEERDASTADMFTVEGLNDNQLGRIARNPSFVADYNHLVSSTSPAGQDPKMWEFEMINRLKKDASQFKKRPIREYLEY
ncbi:MULTISPECIES: replication initiation protein RepM [unclassified Psychrobacter]|uniref:replication initiation protein RepM n=4 Tax=Moraxellaceae TaxID=468 RepID=UPI00186912AD|nr:MULTISPECIES: replication initiation protein RepM [unclassified Psychrobacter]MBE8610770.1 replication initiation protein [Pseudomonas lundensis]